MPVQQDENGNWPWEVPRACPACGAVVPPDAHYVSSVGHLTEPEDAITPYYTCTEQTAYAVAQATERKVCQVCGEVCYRHPALGQWMHDAWQVETHEAAPGTMDEYLQQRAAIDSQP